MPVTRYRDVREMPSPPRATGDEIAMRIRAVWTRAVLLAGLAPRPGVTRFRTIEEAQEARARDVRERMRRIRAERRVTET